MKIAVPKERATGERRAALVPEVAKFVKAGHTVVVDCGEGRSDPAFSDRGNGEGL